MYEKIKELSLGYVWFGEPEEYEEYTGNDEEKIFMNFLNMFKNGKFEKIDEFINFISNSEIKIIKQVGLEVLLLISNHNHFLNFDMFDMFDGCNEDAVFNFTMYAELSMSLQALPYLLDLLEDWEGTDMGEVLLYTIGYMIDDDECINTICDFEAAADKCKEFIETSDINKYYYCGKEIFLGDLTKEVFLEVISCKNNNTPFELVEEPFILSISTGIKCPVDYEMEVTDEVINKVKDYIEQISKMNFQRGKKYFYGYEIN